MVPIRGWAADDNPFVADDRGSTRGAGNPVDHREVLRVWLDTWTFGQPAQALGRLCSGGIMRRGSRLARPSPTLVELLPHGNAPNG